MGMLEDMKDIIGKTKTKEGLKQFESDAFRENGEAWGKLMSDKTLNEEEQEFLGMLRTVEMQWCKANTHHCLVMESERQKLLRKIQENPGGVPERLRDFVEKLYWGQRLFCVMIQLFEKDCIEEVL